ncbi:MAG: 3'-5' exonuclease [Bacteroidota bacterium]
MKGLKQWWQNFRGGQDQKVANYPEWFQSYREQYASPPKDTQVADQRFVIFDTETTGLNPQKDRLLSIGAVRVLNNRILVKQTFSCYLDPELARKKTDAVSIHGLLPGAEGRDYHTEIKALTAFLAWLGNDVLVAHHLTFDVSMINHSLLRNGAGKLQNVGIDTVDLAKQLNPTGYWTPDDAYTLDHLARRYRIPLSDRHTAVGDSYITAVLFLKLIHRLSERRGRGLRLEDIGA